MNKRLQGLTQLQVQQRIVEGRVNQSKNNISKTKKQIVFEHVFTYFNFINVVLALLVLFTGKWKNLTFMGVIFFNTVIGIIQELKVKKTIDQLSVITAKKVTVIRDTKKQVIPIEHLVIDDLIFVESGQQIGSDCQVVESYGLEINESLLTGESLAIEKQEGDELFAGSFVVAGSGLAKVIRVGEDNYSTQLVNKAKNKKKASSQMKRTIEKIIKVLSVVIIPVGFVLFMSQIKANTDINLAIVQTVGGIVGMIPEGLVLLTSMSFILGVGKLAKKNALVQEMEAIEALARADVLCLDKTGTITTGELKVEKVIPFHCSMDKINEIMGIISYCSIEKNVTQKALQDYFSKEEGLIENYVPFSSQRKKQILTLKDKGTFVLGAPEFVLKDISPYENQLRSALNEGYRVLALAKEEKEMHVMAFLMLSDCIRDDAKETLHFFDKSDVDVCILSGDHPLTVSQICKKAGLNNYDCYVDASTLPQDEEAFIKAIHHYRIFGRVTPEQKQKIVHAFQKQNHVVAMVGDGVNDVLALKDADCGIAMASGSDAAKQVAHVVLIDSQFSSMKEIVKEGRLIIANIERVSALYLTKTIYSTVLSLLFAILCRSYPFIPLQLSLISGLAIGIPSFILTLDQSTELTSSGFIKHVLCTAVPCACTIITYILFIMFLSDIFHFSDLLLSTCYFIVTGFISFLVVFLVCRPLNHFRLCLSLFVTISFYLIILLFHRFFNLASLLNIDFLGVIPLCISSIFVLMFYISLIHTIYKHYN